jgi:predicted alpha/beta superfamily hydrolase
MKIKSIICFFLFLNIIQTKAQEVVKPFTIGETRILKSEILSENRTLNIYLPDGFNKEKSYPVIYLLDGSANEDFLHIVGLVQFYKMQFDMPDFLVVGIANVDRKRDFTFHTDLKDLQKEYPTTGHSDKFISFLEIELQPFINKTYKTTDTKYIIGQSLGGLLATEILLKKPTLFTHYLIVSPSLWWDNESLLKQSKSLLDKQNEMNQYVYISVGMQEHKTMVEEANKIAGILKKKKYLNVVYQPLENENHATILHQSISEAFRKLFPLKD